MKHLSTYAMNILSIWEWKMEDYMNQGSLQIIDQSTNQVGNVFSDNEIEVHKEGATETKESILVVKDASMVKPGFK